ncbi:MAG TPA: hypothetical protein VIM04_05550 [Candidatus Binatia bacterium]
MHKVTLAALIAGITVGGIGVLDAAYVIKLKNGNEYVTARYWQEGAQVLFDTYGGTFGVAWEFVAKIAKTDQSVGLDTVTGRNSATPGQAGSKEQRNDAESKSAVASKTEKKRDPDDPVVGEFNRFKEKSKEVDGMLTSEIRDLLREIKVFKDKISGDSKLFLNYGREFNDVHEISSAVEAALESRR